MSNDWSVVKKTEESAKLIRSALRENVYLQQPIRKRRVLEAMIDAMSEKVVKSGTVVADVGKPGDKMFVCEEGSLTAYARDNNNSKITGGLFGEMDFLCGTESRFKIVADRRCKLWVLNRIDYLKILKKYFKFKDEDYIKFFRAIPVLTELNDESLLNIREIIRVECYGPDMTIIKEGESGSEFFIITGGTVRITVRCPDGGEKQVSVLRPTDFFGEGALSGNEKRGATVIAEAPGVECMVLDRKHFSRFLGDLELIRQAVKKRKEINAQIVEFDMEYSYVELKDLEVKDVINNCEFGYVKLVQYKAKPELVFALKMVKKHYVVQYGYTEKVIREKDILMPCKNPFIVRLYKTFRDEKYLYYLQEMCIGGDLKYLMSKEKYLDETVTRFIAACVIEAFDYLHSRQIVYQNLKIENIVFDSNGYAKLVGFGNARKVIDTHEVCCKDMYDSNNVENYDRCNDYMALGSLIFELLVGSPPFQEMVNSDIFSSDDIKNLKFPIHVNGHAKSIINKLWKQKPKQALNLQKSEINDIRSNQWFQDFQWSCLRDKTMKAPYIPKFQNMTDLSNFAKTQKDKETPPDECGSWELQF